MPLIATFLNNVSKAEEKKNRDYLAFFSENFCISTGFIDFSD